MSACNGVSNPEFVTDTVRDRTHQNVRRATHSRNSESTTT
jgi:hypothetical protein